VINPKSNLMFWVATTFFVAVIEIAIITLLVPTERLSSAISKEKQLCVDRLGSDACFEIKKTADSWYRVLALDSGAREATYDFFIGNFEGTQDAIHDFDDRGMHVFSTRFFQNMWGTLYIATWRLSSALSWLPWFLILAVAVVADAAVLRKIEQWRFSHRSALMQYLGMFTIFVVFELFLLVIIMPWAISPLWPPAAYAAVLAAMWVVISNMMKRV